MLTGDAKLARERLDRALRHGDRLAENQRGLLQAAVARLERAMTSTPIRWFERFSLATPKTSMPGPSSVILIGRRVNVVGGSWTDARDAFEHVLALDPQNGQALWTLATIAAREGRRADLDSLTQRLLRLNPRPDIASNVRGQRAIVLGDSAGLERFVADLRARPDNYAQGGGGYITFTTGDLTVGRRLWRLDRGAVALASGSGDRLHNAGQDRAHQRTEKRRERRALERGIARSGHGAGEPCILRAEPFPRGAAWRSGRASGLGPALVARRPNSGRQ